MNGIIYIAKNKVNSKCYVGQTTKSLDHRIKTHYKDSKYRTHPFANALKKYGKQDWEWILLEQSILNKLDVLEQHYIKKFDTMFPVGYNMDTGGNANKVVSPEVRRKISRSLSGTLHPFYGKNILQAPLKR